jgi:hypothetical protein
MRELLRHVLQHGFAPDLEIGLGRHRREPPVEPSLELIELGLGRQGREPLIEIDPQVIAKA